MSVLDTTGGLGPSPRDVFSIEPTTKRNLMPSTTYLQYFFNQCSFYLGISFFLQNCDSPVAHCRSFMYSQIMYQYSGNRTRRLVHGYTLVCSWNCLHEYPPLYEQPEASGPVFLYKLRYRRLLIGRMAILTNQMPTICILYCRMLSFSDVFYRK